MSALQEADLLLIENAVEKFIDENYSFEEKEERLKRFGVFGEHWPTFANLGWLMLPVSEGAGGLGGGVADTQVLLRAFGRGLIVEPFVEVAIQAAKVLEYCRTGKALEQLSAILVGESKFILAHSEARNCVDFSAVKCHAAISGDGYELSGNKVVVWEACAADQFLVSALLDKEPALFSVQAKQKGISLRAIPTIDSRQAADIHFDKVQLSPDALLVKGSAAEDSIKSAILFTFAALAGEVEGIASSLCRKTAEYLNIREQFGSKIGSFQALQHLLADMVIAEEEIKSLAWVMTTVWDMEEVHERERLIRMTKARMCVAGRQLAETAVQLHGGVGVTDELIVGHYLRRLIAIDSWYGDAQQQYLWLAAQN